MSAVTVALLGVVAGALANGGVQTWQRERERRLQARVAARLLYGELIIAGQDVQRIAAMERWPDTNMPDFARATEAWSVQSPAFAACATAGEWAIVGTAYQRLSALPDVAETGRPHNPAERQSLSNLAMRVDAAVEVLTKHSASRRQRKRVRAELATFNARLVSGESDDQRS